MVRQSASQPEPNQLKSRQWQDLTCKMFETWLGPCPVWNTWIRIGFLREYKWNCYFPMLPRRCIFVLQSFPRSLAQIAMASTLQLQITPTPAHILEENACFWSAGLTLNALWEPEDKLYYSHVYRLRSAVGTVMKSTQKKKLKKSEKKSWACFVIMLLGRTKFAVDAPVLILSVCVRATTSFLNFPCMYYQSVMLEKFSVCTVIINLLF